MQEFLVTTITLVGVIAGFAKLLLTLVSESAVQRDSDLDKIEELREEINDLTTRLIRSENSLELAKMRIKKREKQLKFVIRKYKILRKVAANGYKS